MWFDREGAMTEATVDGKKASVIHLVFGSWQRDTINIFFSREFVRKIKALVDFWVDDEGNMHDGKTKNPCGACDRNDCCSHNCAERDEWEWSQEGC